MKPITVNGDLSQLALAYPNLIRAAESPVADTTCAAMLLQSKSVHDAGYKVALSGEGADEAFAGYAWFKSDKIRRGFESVTGQWPEVVNWALRPLVPWLPTLEEVATVRDKFGCMPAQMDVHNAVAASRRLFYSKSMWESLDGHHAMDDFEFDTGRIRRWHPLNRSLYFNYKLMLSGMLLSHKGDRAAMFNSVETRPPFLDEDVVAFAASIHPDYKLSGFREKRILRLFARRLLPKTVAMRRKKMFRAPMWGSFVGDGAPHFVRQLLSRQSLEATSYFDPDAVHRALDEYPRMSRFSMRRIAIEMGMINVIGTQIWHHTFISPTLADLPHWTP
jgi:asparagine synthase (glutamine-hydrolysing)